MIQSLERAFDILELLDRAGANGMGVQDIGQEIGLKLPTPHNMLKTMTLLGYVVQDPNSGKYCIGEKLCALGKRQEFEGSLSEAARPLAQELNKEVNETVVLTLYSNRTWHTLFQIQSEQELSVRIPLPVNKNLFISSTGRCILSELPPGELEKYLKSSGMPKEDWDGINNPASLKEALNEIKKRGYEICERGESLGVGTPLGLKRSGINAAIGISMPKIRFKGKHKETVINSLKKTAESIRIIMEN